MIVLGLTGSTASGKSFALQVFQRLGAEIHEADKAVHRIFVSNTKVKFLVLQRFPQARSENGEVDRGKIGTIVYKSPKDLRWLEKTIHSHVRNDQKEFKQRCARKRKKLLVLEIPLLFEIGAERFCFKSITIFAPRFLRWKRVRSRLGMNWEKWQGMERRQYSDFRKKVLANFCIRSGLGKGAMTREIKKILYRCRSGKTFKNRILSI